MTDQTNAVAAAPTAGAILSKPMSIKDTVLAQFKEAEAGLLAMAERYRDVVYDVTTTKGMAEAKAARADLRDNGRRLLTRTEASVKADVNELKQVMGAEVERLVDIVKPVEDAIDAQIKVEEKRKADEKAERDRVEAERVAAHRANITQLRAYADQAAGQSLESLASAITALEAMEFGPEWEEFAPEADTARNTTVARLREIAESTRQRQENERLQQELAAARAALGAQAPAPAPAATPAPHRAAYAHAPTLAAQPQPAAQFAAMAFDDDDQAPDSTAPAEPRDPSAASLTIGQINERLAHISVTAEGLRGLGFQPAGRRGSAMLYHEEDFSAICAAIARHAGTVASSYRLELAAA
ncbi:hypothetical protein [Acidovorax sp. Root219]|uniref:hypothetical protein n=1 Tax=Acidovorax sp. Root219 TaxID=1736493 RepID=UPI00070F2121|nr:hypothetical protein [Acidovorax sp. Root219]KRC36269.1 hypothetical protein ASE28_01685 [Acidovorax sp. Root219]